MQEQYILKFSTKIKDKKSPFQVELQKFIHTIWYYVEAQLGPESKLITKYLIWDLSFVRASKVSITQGLFECTV